MSPQQRMILKEAVREKLQELEEEEEMQNEIEEGAYIFNSYLSKIVETMTIKNLSMKQDQKSMWKDANLSIAFISSSPCMLLECVKIVQQSFFL